MYEKAIICLFSLITLTGMSITCNYFFETNFSSSFSVWSKNVYSKWKLGLSRFEVLPLVAFKLEWLYFEIAASTGSQRFTLKRFVFVIGKLSLVRVSKFLTTLLK